jgi:hypothetical protein
VDHPLGQHGRANAEARIGCMGVQRGLVGRLQQGGAKLWGKK